MVQHGQLQTYPSQVYGIPLAAGNGKFVALKDPNDVGAYSPKR